MEAFTKNKNENKREFSYKEDAEDIDYLQRDEHWAHRLRENGTESANAQCASPSPTKMTSKKRNMAKSSNQKKGYVLTELDSIKKKLNFDGTPVINQRVEVTTGPRSFNYERPSILKMR